MSMKQMKQKQFRTHFKIWKNWILKMLCIQTLILDQVMSLFMVMSQFIVMSQFMVMYQFMQIIHITHKQV